MNKSKLKKKIRSAAEFLFNPRLLLCLAAGWFITNDWSYVLLVLGTLLHNAIMIAVATGYLTFLWIPFTPEKIVTVAIAIFLLKLIFPSDTRTLGKLHALRDKIRKDFTSQKEKFFGRSTAN